MKFHRIPHASFETTTSRFIQILSYCSVSPKITPLYCFMSTLYIWEKKSPSKWNFRTFECLGEKSPNFFVIFETTSPFFFQLCITLQWCKNLWLFAFLTFDCFCWKYIEIFAKKVQISYVSLFWRLMQNLKKNWSVVSSNDKNLVNFDLSTQKSQKFALSLVPIVQSI